VLVINRFVVTEADAETFAERARVAMATLAACAGYVSGRLNRALDEPEHWCLVTEWESVGTYRRALGSYDVKVLATPLLAESLDEPSAYETLVEAAPGGDVRTNASDRAARPWR
jgi:hypothetical protein